MEEELFGIRVCGLVCDVLRVLTVRGAAVLLGARDYLAELLLPLFKPLFETLQLLLIHGVLDGSSLAQLAEPGALAESKMISAGEKQRQLRNAAARPSTQYLVKNFAPAVIDKTILGRKNQTRHQMTKDWPLDTGY